MNASLDPDRRPIASRDTAWAKAIAEKLARQRWTPNQISVAGMIAAILAGLCLGATSDCGTVLRILLLILAVLLTLARLLANLFDGMVAVSTGQRSPVGALYNEVPDRVSDAAILVGGGYAIGGNVELGYLAAGLAVFTAYVRAQGKAAGAHFEFCGPMAKPQRMAVMIAAMALTAFVPQEAILEQSRLGIFGWALAVVSIGCAITSVRRLRKIASALRAAP